MVCSVALILGVFTSGIIVLSIEIISGINATKSGNFQTASERFDRATTAASFLAKTPLFRSDFETLESLVRVAHLATKDVEYVSKSNSGSIYDLDFNTVISRFPTYILHLQTAKESLQTSLVLKKLNHPSDLSTTLDEAISWMSALGPILSNKAQWIILLQNDNEIRATGGFMGSYALITIEKGKLSEILIEDIYDADGQFAGFFPAPPGVKEYLSSGNGLRLPDANWHPDFPTSAQQILAYFALGKRENIIGVTAITNSTIAKVLDVVGPIPLPDYQTELTADTLDSVLNNRPQPFFPGSIQKKHMLNQAKNQLFFALSQLNFNQWLAVAKVIQTEFANKSILAYSLNTSLNSILSSKGLNGGLDSPDSSSPIVMLVESNVGINKANRWQQRKIVIDLSEDNSITITSTFTNTSPPESPKSTHHYINYYRYIIDSRFTPTSVQVNGNEETEKWNQDTITSESGNKFTQLGGLITVNPAEATIVTTTFSTDQTTIPGLYLIKQPGIPPTNYQVNFPNKTMQNFILTSDIYVGE